MAITNQHTPGLNYKDFKKRVKLENFNDGQTAMLNTRLQLLESFMYLPETTTSASTSQIKPDYTDTKKGRAKMSQWHEKDDERERAKIARKGIWSFQPGSLTIVDLSCPFVDESAACAMFNICLALFLEDRGASERVVALDEAHKVRENPHICQARCMTLNSFSS